MTNTAEMKAQTAKQELGYFLFSLLAQVNYYLDNADQVMADSVVDAIIDAAVAKMAEDGGPGVTDGD